MAQELPPSVEKLFRISEQYGGAASKGKHPALYPYQACLAGSMFVEEKRHEHICLEVRADFLDRRWIEAPP